MIVTNKMVREIRRRRAERETMTSIAADLGLSPSTVWRYASDKMLNTAKARERRHYEKILADPERLERRRANSREYMRRLREKEK